ncbi:MAG: pancreas/duodenum homeobox protein 1 [Desulfobacteraceae bacterium]|nr:pancreas/duodenum homeobox protein 1 [Desulfobacteraceae bacterium]MBC2757520.1 pancreas/duodenum homeobox protein 1 [Desulfobacteraceae bacterium]
MITDSLSKLFSLEVIEEIFPNDRADQFFDVLYGDSSEGAYNIRLVFKEQKDNTLVFEFHLTQCPGKCLRCSLTYGLPKVFSRHPLINVKGLVQKVDEQLNGQGKCIDWKLGKTIEISNALHIIPLIITLGAAA